MLFQSYPKPGPRPGFFIFPRLAALLVAAWVLALPASADTASVDPAAPATAIPQEVKDAALIRLIASADSLKLADDPHWRKLLHYPAGKSRSDIDGGYFFLAPDGRTDRRAELHATLRALLSDKDLSPPMDSSMAGAAMHPLCKFRARLLFLQGRLDIPDSLLASTDCSRYERWRQALQPKGASLIFASSYLNNPASTFGHTFLRINTHEGGGSKSILNYGITYSAGVPAGDDLLFIYKGLFGKYRGTYSMTPYYMSLQKYSHLESRDIWEYDLDLDSLKLEYLLGHIWEVGASWMEYYFFDENCSYNVITLLDAADPSWNLSEDLGYLAVVPAETIRMAMRRKGLVKESRWRPSLLTAFRIKADSLPDGQRRILQSLMRDKASPADLLKQASGTAPDSLAALADAALDYFQYRKRRAKGKDAETWGERQRALLVARSGLPRTPERRLQPRAEDTPPEAGHGAQAVGVKAGVSAWHGFTEMHYRFAYHDLNAAEAGFLPGSAIEALKIRGRITCERDCRDGVRRAELSGAELINILSLSPMDRLLRPWSWTARGAYDTRPREGGEEGIAYRPLTLEAGVGVSTAWTPQSRSQLMPFALLLGKARYMPWDGHRLDAGPMGRLGMRLSMGRAFSLQAEHRMYWPVAAVWDRHAPGRLEESDWLGEARLSAGKDADIRLGFTVRQEQGELSLGWNGYF